MNQIDMELAVTKVDTGLNKYLRIMSDFYDVDVSKNHEFQKRYNGFYRVRQRSPDFYKEYYNYMEMNKKNSLKYSEVLTHFYNEFNRIEASFSSKLLATINPEMPVWDTFVLNNLGLKKPSYARKNRLAETIDLYQKICDWYWDFLQTPDAKVLLECFNNKYGNVGISDTKKIDLILWQMR